MRLTIVLLLLASGCPQHTPPPPAPPSSAFGDPQAVTILGWQDHAMEPFVSRDGQLLFFNNSNAPKVNTDLHFATRVDDLTFQYGGPIAGANSPDLDGVASMASDGTFYFVSTRSYAQTASTLYRAHYTAGTLTGVELVPGVSTAKPGIVNFDAEISPDGNTLYFVEARFDGSGSPQTADLLVALRDGDHFSRSKEASALLSNVNSDFLEYAPAISASGLELFLTRTDGKTPPVILRSTRTDEHAAFGLPEQLTELTGFVEAATLSADESAIYFHRKTESGVFGIVRASRRSP